MESDVAAHNEGTMTSSTASNSHWKTLVLASVWKVFIKLRWHGQKLTYVGCTALIK
jgi:hypothetical protein